MQARDGPLTVLNIAKQAALFFHNPSTNFQILAGIKKCASGTSITQFSRPRELTRVHRTRIRFNQVIGRKAMLPPIARDNRRGKAALRGGVPLSGVSRPKDCLFMIRIVSRNRRRVRETARELPVGTIKLVTAELGIARYERVEATSGCFSSAYAQFAAVLTELPSTGPVRLNGGDMHMLPERSRALNFFRPDDRVEGVWRTDNTYEVLLFAPGYVERFLGEELNGRFLPVAPLLRGQPTTTIVWLWRQLANAMGQTADVEKMQVESTLNMLIALLAAPGNLIELPVGAGLQHEVGRAVRFIHENLASELSIDKLASIAGLSKFHFCRVFKRSTGFSVHRYIVEQRLLLARSMLESSRKPISQIALDAGFASQSHLNSACRRRFGATPRGLRLGPGENAE